MITYTILAAAALYTIYLLIKMVRAEQKNCSTAPTVFPLYRRLFLGGLIGSILAYVIIALIQPDAFWAIYNPRKVSTVTQGMLSRPFFILAMSLGAIFIGGIPGALIGLLSQRWQGKSKMTK